MVESFIQNRITFPQKGMQGEFLCDAKKSLGVTWISFSNQIGVSPRTMTAWVHERLRMSDIAAQKISSLTKVSIPKPHTIVVWDEHMKSIARQGGQSYFKKYGTVGGDIEYRKKKWKEWWEETGRYSNNHAGFQSIIKVDTPQKDSRLAEFIGILLGDGGIAAYQVHITLSNKEEKYTQYVMNLTEELFKVKPALYKIKYAQAIRIVVSRKELVDFCEKVGFEKGNKIDHQVDIPEWIKKNKQFAQECVRGLVDTDGCFYINFYNSNNKKYTYFKIAFVSGSVPLLKSVHKILHDSGIHAVIVYRKGQRGGDVRIVSNEDVQKYIETIGSHNEKHLKKIRDWKKL